MDLGKNITTATGWVLTLSCLIGTAVALAMSVYHTFWTPANYQVATSDSFISISYGGISPLLAGLFPLILSLLVMSIGHLFLKAARKSPVRRASR